MKTINMRKSRKIAEMIRRLVDHIRKEKSLSENLAREAFDQIDDLAKEALISPFRNCDIGTADEQTKRFSDFCAAHRHTDLPRCAGCPLENTPPDTGCSFAWGQMLYEAEEGGSKK